ncbi:hypothetical protein F4808DRAFT_453711 [Astrocystis sublimbata]|nr:hypothetical protein F4808DRAFT_453711 [Astrocystis sublimbata]
MASQPALTPLRCLRLGPQTTTPLRTFTTTVPLPRQTPSHLTVPKALVPDYPYGPFRTYKQRNQGLFGTTKIRSGNVVASKYGNKSRTTWLPNRHTKRLWSPALNAFIRTRMTASILHTIDRLGGIDAYLLGGKAKRIKELGPAGWALRWKVMQSPMVQERFARERVALGLPPKEGGVVVVGEVEDTNVGVDGAVLDRVDAMLAADEEFVFGEPDPAAEGSGGSERYVYVSEVAEA